MEHKLHLDTKTNGIKWALDLIFKKMGNILYILAVIFLVLWAIGFLGFELHGIIHILLVLAILSVLLRIIKGGPVVK